jgi:hypothetical protein
MRRAVAFLMLLTVLVPPSAAIAQSAGDEQYTDPFASPEQEPQQQPQEQEPQAPAEPAPVEPAPAEPAPAEATPAPTPSAEAPATADSSAAQPADPSLPVTGLPALMLLVAGAGMIAVGAALRRRL